ncbi:MAG: protease family protein [Clostridiales bacterium]|nr:protease family protein [Clostridiales bacterium]
MNEHEQVKGRGVSILGANMIFLIGIVSLVGVDIFMGRFIKTNNIKMHSESFYWIALITEFVFILLPAYLYVQFSGQNVRKVLRINRLSFVNVILIVGIMIFALPLIGFVNFIVVSIINTIGRPIPNPLPDISNLRGLLIGTAVIAGSAGICEEVMFRGVILRGYERFGRTTALIVTSLLFSVMHRNIQNVLGIFFIGLLIGYLVYRTNSIFAGMIAHFTNNAMVVLITYGFSKLANMMGTNLKDLMAKQQAAGLPNMNMVAVIFWLSIVIFSAVVFLGLIMLLKYCTRNTAEQSMQEVRNTEWGVRREVPKVKFSHYIPLIIGLALIGLKFAQGIFYILSMTPPVWLKLF